MDVSTVKKQTPVQPTQAPKRTEAAQQQQKNAESRPKTAESKPPQEAKPRPTVNGQGQHIGGRLSVTA